MDIIGIIGAMPSELADIRKNIGDAAVVKRSGFEFYISTFGGKLIVNACCGIAKVNAALCAQTMFDKFNVEAIINIGVAGGMDTSVKVCDVVISNEVFPHDLELRFLENYPPYNSIFKADNMLIDTACAVCSEADIPHHVGRMVSGEAFISSNEVKKNICEKFSPLAVDMESSAIGHCAFMNSKPFLCLRCISDNADDEGEMSFDEFEKKAAERAAKIVLEMVKRI